MFEILAKQKEFFLTNTTLDVNFRLSQLKKLKSQIRVYYDQLLKAFKQDLNKGEFDVASTEFAVVINELNYMLRHLKNLAKPRRVFTSITNLFSTGYKISEPYGSVLVASPWNYPFQLTLVPTIGAIAGGNTVVIKPSRNTPNVTKVIKKIFDVFDDNYVYVVTDEEEIKTLFDQKFDLIFYTGSANKAKELMQKQSQFLTPLILELGGKSPCIIDDDADIETSAKRVVWGKFLNAGQTCVAPDYVLLHSNIKEVWLEKAKEYIQNFYYQDEKLSKDFVKVVNAKSLERLNSYIDKNKVFCGGNIVNGTLEPTILNNITRQDCVMREEIFGPILPVIEFDDLDQELEILRTLDKPLAFYYFGNDSEKIKKVLTTYSFGGGCINDTVMHFVEEGLPFGGIGLSGMGKYHGKYTFYAFSHIKSVLKKSKTELNIKYPPVTKGKLNFLKKFFRI